MRRSSIIKKLAAVLLFVVCVVGMLSGPRLAASFTDHQVIGNAIYAAENQQSLIDLDQMKAGVDTPTLLQVWSNPILIDSSVDNLTAVGEIIDGNGYMAVDNYEGGGESSVYLYTDYAKTMDAMQQYLKQMVANGLPEQILELVKKDYIQPVRYLYCHNWNYWTQNYTTAMIWQLSYQTMYESAEIIVNPYDGMVIGVYYATNTDTIGVENPVDVYKYMNTVFYSQIKGGLTEMLQSQFPEYQVNHLIEDELEMQQEILEQEQTYMADGTTDDNGTQYDMSDRYIFMTDMTYTDADTSGEAYNKTAHIPYWYRVTYRNIANVEIYYGAACAETSITAYLENNTAIAVDE